MVEHIRERVFTDAQVGGGVMSVATARGSGLARCLRAVASVVSICLVSFPAASADFSVAGFGTIGYSRSDVPFTYDRFINEQGTFRRDSVLGLQLDARLDNKFGATVQVKAAPQTDNDSRYEGSIAWAFVSYRPTNDWLLRAGRQRMPLYLHSANFDVGVTYEFARLPTEMYSISPNNEIDGLSFSRNWSLARGDVVLDGFWGKTDVDVRLWARDSFAPIQSAGPIFRNLALSGGGFSLVYRRDEDLFRMAFGSVMVKRRDGGQIPVTFPLVSTPFPGATYYQVDNALPGPGIPYVDQIRISTLILGAEVDFGAGFRIVSEYALTRVPQSDLSTQSDRGYFSVLKRMNEWTPYVTYAYLRSHSKPLNLYQTVNGSAVPGFVPGSASINASQRAGADQVFAYDQRSWAIGTSFALSPTSKIKAEAMRVHIGKVSSLVDAPPGSNIRQQNINVFSLSYSMVF